MFMQFRKFLLLLPLLVVFSCTRRCPIGTCYTRKVHTHDGNKYRGQPWFAKQNPKIGEKLKDPIREGVPQPKSERKKR